MRRRKADGMHDAGLALAMHTRVGGDRGADVKMKEARP
jgi:hypothetical protein